MTPVPKVLIKCLKCNMPVLPSQKVTEWHGMRFHAECAIRLGASIIAASIEGTPRLTDFAYNILELAYKDRGFQLRKDMLLSPAALRGQLLDYTVRVAPLPCYYCSVDLAVNETCKVYMPADDGAILYLHTKCVRLMADALKGAL